MKGFDQPTGVDKHTWNDWCMLANDIVMYHGGFYYKWVGSWDQLTLTERLGQQELAQKEPDFAARLSEYERSTRETYKKCFEGTLREGRCLGVVRPYSDRLKQDGINLESLTSEDEVKINAERQMKGEQQLNWKSVRRLDELAKACNGSLKKSIYQNEPFEWKFLYESCLEVLALTYGPGMEFFKIVAIP